MRVIRNISQRLLGLAPLALIPVAVLAAGQTTPPAPKSFAGSHSIVVIGPNSPLFDSLLEKDFPGVESVNYFQQVKPLLAIIHNNTLRVIKAYVVKWTITNSDGTTSTAMLPVIQEPLDQWVLAGQRTVLSPAGSGQGSELISPFFHWDRRQFPVLLGSNAVSGTFQALAQRVSATQQPLVWQAQNATSIRVQLDGAIFGDGVFIGPDTSLLYERFQAAQQAELDEAAWVSNQLKAGTTEQELQAGLSQQVYAGRNAVGTDQASLYTAARGRAAERFLGSLSRSGLTALATRVSQTLATPRLILSRQASS